MLIVTRFASGAGTACIYLPGWETTNEALPPCQTTVIAPVRLDELEFLSTVYVIENGKARQQQVTLGARQNDVVEVTSGLTGNEMLATTNLSQLATGVTVRVGGANDDEGATGNGGADGGRSGGSRRGTRP